MVEYVKVVMVEGGDGGICEGSDGGICGGGDGGLCGGGDGGACEGGKLGNGRMYMEGTQGNWLMMGD